MQLKLIEQRKLASITQKDMAKYLGICEASYVNKERGKKQFTLEEMYKLARYFNLTLDELFMERNTPNKE